MQTFATRYEENPDLLPGSMISHGPRGTVGFLSFDEIRRLRSPRIGPTLGQGSKRVIEICTKPLARRTLPRVRGSAVGEGLK
jgi:hypothetical protein